MPDLNRRNAFFDALVARRDLIWMGQNTTHLEPSQEVLQAIEESIRRREFQIYAPPLGLDELRTLILDDLGLQGFEVIVTDGAVSGLYHICKSLAPEVSQLITTDPGWPWPQQFVSALGKPSQIIDVYRAEADYKLRLEELASVLTERAIIYLIDPLNPLGSSYSAAELKGICDLARGAHCFVIHDCTYRHFAKEPSLAATYYPEGTITTYSFSKWLGLAGFRVGAIAAMPGLAARLATAPPNSLGSNIVAQRAAIAGLKIRKHWLKKVRSLNERNQVLIEGAVRTAGIGHSVVYPSNGNFLAIALEAGEWSGDTLAAKLLEDDIFIRSGTYQSTISGQRFVKISTAVPVEWAQRCAATLERVSLPHRAQRAVHSAS